MRAWSSVWGFHRFNAAPHNTAGSKPAALCRSLAVALCLDHVGSRQLIVPALLIFVPDCPEPADTEHNTVDVVANVAHEHVGGLQRLAVDLDHANSHKALAESLPVLLRQEIPL